MAEYQYAKSGDPVEAQMRRKEAELKASSNALRNRLFEFFTNWEKQHGFKKGAGVLLVPAGWTEKGARR